MKSNFDIDEQLKAKFKLFQEIDKIANDHYSNTKTNNSSNMNFSHQQSFNQKSYGNQNFPPSINNIQDNLKLSKKDDYKVPGNNNYLINSNDSNVLLNKDIIPEATFDNFDNYRNETNALSNGRRPSYSSNNTGPISSNKNLNKKIESNLEYKENDNNLFKSNSNKKCGYNAGNSSCSINKNNISTKESKRNVDKSIVNNIQKDNNTIFDRLYEIGQERLTKQRKKSEEQDNKFKLMASPKINKSSKNIVRDSSKFSERLYPTHPRTVNSNNQPNNHYANNDNFFDPINVNINKFEECKVNQEDNISFNEFEYILDNLNKFSKHDLENNILTKKSSKYNQGVNAFNAPPKYFTNYEKHNQYAKKNVNNQAISELSFKPVICKNSEKIANKLESSFERLTRRRKRKTSNSGNTSPNNFSNYIYRSENSLNNSNSSSKFSRSFELYKDEFRRQEKLKNIRDEKTKLEDEKFKKDTPFKPIFKSKSTKKDHNHKEKTPQEIEIEFQERQSSWQKKVELKDKKHKDSLNEREKIQNTFNPNLYKKKLKDDDINIRKIMNDSNKYVNRRQKSLNKQQEDFEYYNKRFIVNPNFKCHITKLMEPKINSAGSYEFKERLKRSKNCHTPDNLNKTRNDLKTNYFFRENDEAFLNKNVYETGLII